MKILGIIFLVLGSVFGLNINTAEIYKDSIKFGVDDVDYNKIGQIFDSSMMRCNPNLNGIFHLESGSFLTFYSTTNLPTSTTFDCEYNGNKISFKSDEFRVINFKNIKKDSFIVAFNDDIKNLKNSIKISDENLKFDITKIDNSSFIIDVNNPNDLKYDIFITKNLQSIHSKTLKKDVQLTQSSGMNLNKMETLNINTSLIQGISYPNKTLGFRLCFENYISINNLFIKSKNAKNFNLGDTKFIEISDDKYYYCTDILSKDFKPNMKYEITLLEGFGEVYDDWGVTLKDEVKFSFTTPNYKKELRFLDQKPYISNKGGVFINSINISEIKTMLLRVDDENLRYFLNFSEGNESFSEYKTKNFTLNMVPNQDINSTIKFDDLKDGIYKFDVFYKNDDGLEYITKYLYFSDIAIHTKIFNDSIFVFLNRISNNEVISEAKITIFSDKNKIITTGTTTKDGTFVFDKKDLIKEKPKSLFVEFGNEKNFLIFNEKNGEFKNLYKKPLLLPKAYVYLSSDIIRPNNPFEGIIIMKQNFKSLKNLPVKIEIYDPKNSKIYDKSLNLDEFGTIKLNIKDGFKLGGKYNLKVIFEDQILTTKEFSVESFVAQTLKANVKFDKNIYKNSENLGLNLNAAYLFGQNAANLSANLNIFIHNSSFENYRFSDYKFDDDSIYNHPIFRYNAPILLDENGSANLFVKPNFSTKLNSKLEINANFMVNDSGKSSSDYSSSIIYPYESIVGICKKDLNLKFISINPMTLQDVNSTLKVALYEESWSYNFNEKGYISWFNAYALVDEFDIKDNFLDLSNLKDGSYKLVAKDLNSTHESAIRFSVGSSLVPTDDLSIATIKLDKKSYKKGDIINANISSPLKDALFLVTLEDEKVLDYGVVKVSNYSANVKFEIKDDFNGMYLSAKALRVGDTPNYLLPFKAQNSVYISKDNSDKKLELSLDLPKISPSNQAIKASIKTAPNSKIYVFLVDYGVLNITNQKSPDTFNFFNTIKEKHFSNFDIYNELTHFKTSGKILSFGSGGSGFLMGLKKYLDPLEDKQTYIKMLDFTSDENGEVKFDFEVPINTKIRIDVIALNDEKIGEISQDLIIKDDILVKMPNILYLLHGDDLELPVRIFNNTDQNKTMNLDINSSSNLSVGGIKTTEILEPNSFKTLNLKVNAKSSGKAFIKILNTTLNFTVLPSSSINTKVINGILDKNRTITLNDTYKSAKLSIANSPAAMFLDSKDKLIGYPYGCAEQISAKLLAMFYVKPKDEKEEKYRQNFINSGIKSLEAKQKNDGNFGYWDSQSEVNEYASVFATDVLLMLKDKGFEVSNLVIDKALKALLNKGISSRLSDFYAAYLLSEKGLLSGDKINIFYDKKYYQKSIVNSYMMGIILKNANLQKEFEIVKENINKFNLDEFEPEFESFSSKIRNLSFALYLDLKYFNYKNNALLEKIVSLKDTISSTQDRAFVLRALNSFENNEKINVKVTLGDNIYLINGQNDVDLNLTSSSLNLEPVKGKPYFSLLTHGYEELPLKHEFSDKSLNIYREFVDMDGNLVNLDELKLNDIIFAKVILETKANYEDILVYQKSPSCFEIINERVIQNIRTNNTLDSVKFSYVDVSDTAITNFLKPIYKGENAIFYTPFRVVLKGKCVLPEIRVERMYDEKINDYDLERRDMVIK